MDLVTLSSLPKYDQIRLKNSAKIAQGLEDYWARKISKSLEGMVPEILESLADTGRFPKMDVERLFVEHFFEVAIQSTKYAMSEVEEESHLPPKAGRTLARFPQAKIPKSLKDIMALYDQWKKGRYTPKRPAKQAKEIKDLYLKKVRSVWETYSEDFRKGDVATQDLVVQQIKEAASTTTSRAKNIVRTETTNYYNESRKNFYDESQDITHYLFIAIRDATTSPWCTPLTLKGKRGRSGLVYEKNDPLCEKERPACHPGCRSEYLPLNKLNPAHVKFIYDRSIQRRAHECFPLLHGWRSS